MTVRLEWRDTTDFGYRYYLYLGEIVVGYVSHMDHRPGEPQWSAGTSLPVPDYPVRPFLGHFYSIAFSKAEVESAVNHFFVKAGLMEPSE